MAALSIRAKLIGSFSGIVFVTAGLGGIGLSSLGSLEGAVVEISQERLPAMRQALGAENAVQEARVFVLRRLIADTPADVTDVEGRFQQAVLRVNAFLGELRTRMADAESRALVEEFGFTFASYRAEYETMRELVVAGKRKEAEQHFKGKMAALAIRMGQISTSLIQANGRAADQAQVRAEAVARSADRLLIGGLILAVLASGVAATLIIRGIGRGIGSITSAMNGLAAGDLDVKVPFAGERTELGSIAGALQVFKDALLMKRAADAASAQEARQKVARAEALERLITAFESASSGLVSRFAAGAGQLHASAQSMTETAHRTAHQATTVAGAAEQTSANVQTVAASAEELAATIADISRQVNESASISEEAVRETGRADGVVQTLAGGAQRIGAIVSLIGEIAEKTNLLALNASIEAARAGAAGRGFAVVAAEVKELAAQTAKATDEITQQVGAIQSSAQDVAIVLGSVGQTVQRMATISAAVAAAAEEQGAATQEIARNVQQAAQGTEQVTGSIAAVRDASTDAGHAAAEVLTAAEALTGQSSELSAEVRNFLAGVRAA